MGPSGWYKKPSCVERSQCLLRFSRFPCFLRFSTVASRVEKQSYETTINSLWSISSAPLARKCLENVVGTFSYWHPQWLTWTKGNWHTGRLHNWTFGTFLGQGRFKTPTNFGTSRTEYLFRDWLDWIAFAAVFRGESWGTGPEHLSFEQTDKHTSTHAVFELKMWTPY